MSILRRASDHLPFSELISAWAVELEVPATKLGRRFLDDLVAGKLDAAGPVWMITELGGPRRIVTSNDLRRFINQHGHTGWLSKAAARSGIISETYERPDWAYYLPDNTAAADVEWYFWRRLVASREIVLTFAERRGLPVPSWWAGLVSERATSPGAASAHAATVASKAPAMSASGIRTTHAVRAEKACEDWIVELTERPKNKEFAFEQAKAKFSVGRKAFDRAWSRVAPLEWKAAGRRKRS